MARSDARWPDCASGWHDRCTRPDRCGCPCHTRTAARPATAEPEHTTWDVLAVVKITDGDTVRVVRSQLVNIDGRHYRVTDEPPPNQPPGVALRLLWVDTPERGDHPGWEQARADLTAWINAAKKAGPISAVCYESGGWDRIMADLLDVNGNSAAQYMMTGAGWPPYQAP